MKPYRHLRGLYATRYHHARPCTCSLPEDAEAVDLKTLNDGLIARHYRLRFAFGVIVMLLMAVPVAVHSHSAINSLFNRPSDWIPADMPVRVAFDDFARRFSVTDLIMIGWDGADLGAAELEAATRLLQPLCDQPDAAPDSPSTFDNDQASEEIGLAAEGASDITFDPQAIATVEALNEKLGAQPLHWARNGSQIFERMISSPTNLPEAAAAKRLSGSIIGPDGKQTCMIISLTEIGLTQRRLVCREIRMALAQQLAIEPEALAFVGGPYDGTVIDEASIRSVQTFSPPSAVVAALLCFLCLRSFALTATITAIAVIGEGFVLSAVYYSGSPMNAVLIVLPPLIFVLTVSSGIHLSNYYLDALSEFPTATRAQAAAIAMRAGTVPSLLATSTTIIGLGSLVLVRLEPIRIFGIVATLGLMVTMLLLLTVLPGAMMLYSGPRRITDRALLEGTVSADSESWTHRRFRLFLRQLLEHPKLMITLSIIIIGILGSGLWKLNTSVNVPRMFGSSHPLRQQYAWFEANLGPTINGEMLLKFPPSALDGDAIDRLALVRDAHVAIANEKDVGGVLSAVSFLPPVPRGRGLSATASRSVIRSQLVDAESAVRKLGFISRDDEAEVWRIGFRLPMTTQSDYGPEIDALGAAVSNSLAESFKKEGLPETLMPEVVLTGGVQIAQKAQEVLFNDLFTSFLSAFLVVAVVMMILLRNVLGGLVAMIPNIFPTMGIFGFMGLAGLPLDIGAVMSASIALGIAVDDTIHLLSRFGSRRAAGMNRKRAAWGALKQCAMAMIHTTVVCGISLLVYGMSDFVPTRQFSFLMFGLLGIALLGDLVLLPALMVSGFGHALSRPALADPGAELEDTTPIDSRRLPFMRRQSQPSTKSRI